MIIMAEAEKTIKSPTIRLSKSERIVNPLFVFGPGMKRRPVADNGSGYSAYCQKKQELVILSPARC